MLLFALFSFPLLNDSFQSVRSLCEIDGCVGCERVRKPQNVAFYNIFLVALREKRMLGAKKKHFHYLDLIRLRGSMRIKRTIVNDRSYNKRSMLGLETNAEDSIGRLRQDNSNKRFQSPFQADWSWKSLKCNDSTDTESINYLLVERDLNMQMGYLYWKVTQRLPRRTKSQHERSPRVLCNSVKIGFHYAEMTFERFTFILSRGRTVDALWEKVWASKAYKHKHWTLLRGKKNIARAAKSHKLGKMS